MQRTHSSIHRRQQIRWQATTLIHLQTLSTQSVCSAHTEAYTVVSRYDDKPPLSYTCRRYLPSQYAAHTQRHTLSSADTMTSHHSYTPANVIYPVSMQRTHSSIHRRQQIRWQATTLIHLQMLSTQSVCNAHTAAYTVVSRYDDKPPLSYTCRRYLLSQYATHTQRHTLSSVVMVMVNIHLYSAL